MVVNNQTAKTGGNRKVRILAALGIVALLVVAGGAAYVLSTFAQSGSSPASGITTSSSAAPPPPTVAAFTSVTLAAAQSDPVDVIGTCTPASGGQTFSCTGTTLVVGESYTITVVDSNPNSFSEPISVNPQSTNPSVYTVVASGSNPPSIPANGSVDLVFTATCMGQGSAVVNIGVAG